MEIDKPRKFDGIVTRPGVHKRGDTLEIITPELLRAAITFQPRIPLIIGPHPPGGKTNPNDWVGHVQQTWNETRQRVDGEFLFYREHWDKISRNLQRRLANEEIVELSAGYEIGDLVEGAQRGRRWDHLAINVQNPMHEDVGVNVRMEAELPDNFRIEQEAQIGEEKEPEDKETVDTPVPTTVTFTDEQFKQLLDTIRPVAPEPVVSETKEEEVIEEVLEEPSTPTPPEPRMEPEKVIPTAPSPPSETEYATEDDMVAVSIKILGDKEKK